jgi:hypothetical protein
VKPLGGKRAELASIGGRLKLEGDDCEGNFRSSFGETDVFLQIVVDALHFSLPFGLRATKLVF